MWDVAIGEIWDAAIGEMWDAAIGEMWEAAAIGEMWDAAIGEMWDVASHDMSAIIPYPATICLYGSTLWCIVMNRRTSIQPPTIVTALEGALTPTTKRMIYPLCIPNHVRLHTP